MAKMNGPEYLLPLEPIVTSYSLRVKHQDGLLLSCPPAQYASLGLLFKDFRRGSLI